MDIVEYIIGPLTITKVLVTCLIALLTYYMWPVLNPQLRHIPGPWPLPILGNFLTANKRGGLDMLEKYGKVFRVYEGRSPSIVVADAAKLRQILIKDFGTFTNRRVIPCRGVLKYSLFDAYDEAWRRHRHLLTPSFTSGKLKHMITMIQKCSDRLCRNIGEMADKGEEIEAKRFTGMYTMEVIAGTGFGMDIDVQENPDSPFASHLRKASDQLKLTNPVIIIMIFFPFLLNVIDKMGVLMFPRDSTEFYTQLMLSIIEDRKKSNEGAKDLLQLLVNAHKTSLDEEAKRDLEGTNVENTEALSKALSADEILAESLTFMFAGFDTTSTTLSFLLYELSQNQDVQEKLYQEVKDTNIDEMDKNAEIYELTTRLPYLEKCVQETLRMFPPAPKVDRICSKDITIDGIFIPKGTSVTIPIYLMQNDPDVWKDADKFDPSRFDEEEKNKRDPLNHMPFGVGPRQCIGMRLALLEVKLATINILKQFQLLPSQKPFEPDITVISRTKSGAWIKPKRRERD